jgi:hypothetical protein
MISIFPPSTVLITDAEPPPGIHPPDGLPVASQAAAAAFQATFVGEGHMVLPQLVAFGRTDVETRLQVATLAELFFHLDVNFLVDLELVERQLVFYFQIAFLAFRASEIKFPRVTLPFMLSRRTWNVFWRGLPSLVKIFRASPQAHCG